MYAGSLLLTSLIRADGAIKLAGNLGGGGV